MKLIAKIFELLKSAWLQKIIGNLFDKGKILGKLDGKKTAIGRLLMFITALFAFAHQEFPEFFADGSLLANISVPILAVVGWALTELGLQHKSAKEASDEGVVEEKEF